MTSSANDGLVHLASSQSVADTMNALEAVVRRKGMKIAARIDHSADAAKAALEMPPTQLLIFGSPAAGTPIMLAAPTAAIDLPLKALVWQDKQGRVWLSYSDLRYLQRRHGFPGELLGNIAGMEAICEEAVSPPN